MSDAYNVNEVFSIIEKSVTDLCLGTREDSVVLVIGFTGSGKSTLLNALCGCKMALFTPKELKELFEKEADRKIRRFEVLKTSEEESKTEIGHQSDTSTTKIPVKVCKGNFVFWDTCGFLDSRGESLRTAHAVITMLLAQNANKVRLLITIEYNSLDTSKSAEIRSLITSLTQFFGDRHTLMNHSKSIIFIITKVPLSNPDEEDEDLHDMTKTLKKDLPESSVIICDPIDRENLKCRPVSKLSYALEQIEKLTPIDCTSQNVFHVSLTSETLVSLLPAMKSLVVRIYNALVDGSVDDSVAQDFRTLKTLQKYIDNPLVKDVIATVRQLISNTIQEYRRSFKTELYQLDEEILKFIEDLFLKENYSQWTLERFKTIWKEREEFRQRWKFLMTKALAMIEQRLNDKLRQFIDATGPTGTLVLQKIGILPPTADINVNEEFDVV